MIAARIPNPEVTELLLEFGADVNLGQSFDVGPLFEAARYNSNPEVIRVLLDAGADPRATDFRGKKAIDYADENPALRGSEVYWELNDRSF